MATTTDAARDLHLGADALGVAGVELEVRAAQGRVDHEEDDDGEQPRAVDDAEDPQCQGQGVPRLRSVAARPVGGHDGVEADDEHQHAEGEARGADEGLGRGPSAPEALDGGGHGEPQRDGHGDDDPRGHEQVGDS
ncbi:hypothetical protein [Nocardioides zeae]|uniref:Uncharacterized protein n=1 Tax=Nocardioides zeae TaxID=1457234 RepID=A0AAJ1WZ93_9ACTN|nr:hypothetical protein [Nocardioides zeae]MDQ1103403.1 hypothetical protein [Nocardioides zeae]